ncbi:hypothetical protein BT93_L1361 [Corymbia citriodora subsp. variegata]|uniref:Uncharacterized protein n=1 Tax=Corymbia citriodora subsp. variegata TaxID=360336 RepID=A0A8T0CP54_CORYI|nr:hypothetical protein BT93_L1361 [Corymbia citriodora subsp. variegata]
MDREKDSPFSNGLYLANLAASSNLVQDSWNAISKLERRINQHFLLRFIKRVFPLLDPATFRSDGDNHVIIKEFRYPNYNIIAFFTSPVTPGYLQEESDLVPSSEINDFQFLCSKSIPTFRLNKAAISLFNSLQNELSQLRKKVATSAKSKDSVPYIITGDCLGGSIAFLFTLWLLNTLEPTKSIPLCITFSSPLPGDSAFQEAVSQYSAWNSCFLHVVLKDDSFPSLSICSPTTNQSPYKPFGTFLFCSDSGVACFDAPESIMELLPSKIGVGNKKSQRLIDGLERRLTHRDRSRLNGQEDLYKAGVTTQVMAVDLNRIQQQTEGTGALIEDIVKHERGVMRQRKEPFDPAKELREIKVHLAYLEWYMMVCKASRQGPGYYDSFKNAGEGRDGGVDNYKTILTDYWERVVREAEKRPQLSGKQLRNRWLFAGTNYRRIVEPLDIAEYYKRGRKDYLKRGRSNHYKELEKWLGNRPRKNSENIESRLTEDSCFWAHVEEAIRSCKLLDSGEQQSNSERENLMRFEEYVMRLINNCAVSLDIFLGKSSYMQWWGEYEEILKKGMMGHSHDSQSDLVRFMRNEPRKNYIERSRGVNETNAPSTRGASILPKPLSLPFLLVLPLCYFLGNHLRKHLF